MSALFSAFRIKSIEFKNRVFLSPMCQYSSVDGLPTEWHLVHLGGRAVGGAGLIVTEASAVSPEGRITLNDSGIWSDAQAEAFRRITCFIKAQNAVPGIQLAHAGRKASTDIPWRGGRPLTVEQGGWQSLAPSPVPFDPSFPTPREMTRADLEQTLDRFAQAARRSRQAGFEVLEIHMAHGYLLHEFLSPITNLRSDEYGGDLANRIRYPLAVARAVRENWPAELPLFVRISCTDWIENGWDLTQAVSLARRLKEIGVDLIDCSSGGLVPSAKIPIGPGYQTPFAAKIRAEADIAVAAVGLITRAEQAEQIVATGSADAVFIGRELLRDPCWPQKAANALGIDSPWPPQYLRAKPG